MLFHADRTVVHAGVDLFQKPHHFRTDRQHLTGNHFFQNLNHIDFLILAELFQNRPVPGQCFFNRHFFTVRIPADILIKEVHYGIGRYQLSQEFQF